MRGNKTRKAKERGITLIALVITIIILIILATIAIRGAVGDNGLVGWAKEARDKTKQGEEDEDKAMSDLDKYIEEQTADSGVIINISKTPETEKTGAVILKVENIEGIEGEYTITNPDGENLNIQKVTENGTYTFKVTETNTGERYIKSVQVSNIDIAMQDYYVDDEMSSDIFIFDKSGNKTTFEDAYVIYNNERIDISSCIKENGGANYIEVLDVANYLKEIGKVSDMNNELLGTDQIFEIVKDNKSYFSYVHMAWLDLMI